MDIKGFKILWGAGKSKCLEMFKNTNDFIGGFVKEQDTVLIMA